MDTRHLTDEEYLNTLIGEHEERFAELINERTRVQEALEALRDLETRILRVEDSLTDDTMDTRTLLGYAHEAMQDIRNALLEGK